MGRTLWALMGIGCGEVPTMDMSPWLNICWIVELMCILGVIWRYTLLLSKNHIAVVQCIINHGASVEVGLQYAKAWGAHRSEIKGWLEGYQMMRQEQ